MRIRLLAFATAREALGHAELDLDLPAGARLSDLAATLQADFPGLAEVWPRLAVAVDGELAGAHTPLHDGSEVALLPPVSGGAAARRAALVEEPIDLATLSVSVADASCGAVLVFVGNVRDRHRGRSVDRITYDAYRPMALRAMETIAEQLEAGVPNLRLRIVHRLGEIPVGEASVAIAVASPHRDAAYAVSRQALERLKREVPIWKLEHYEDGETVWREEEPLSGIDQRS